MLKRMLVVLSISIMVAGTARANEGEGKMENVSHAGHSHEEHDSGNDADRQIPEQVTSEHWAYQKIVELLQKYVVKKKLPEGKSCSKSDLAECLLEVMIRIVEQHEKGGGQAINRDDLKSIVTLYAALEADLAQMDGYRLRKKTIEDILVLIEPEAPAFEYKAGVNGFLRSDVVGNFRLPNSSYTPDRSEGRFLYRVKPYVYWHPTDYLDIHLEGQGYGFTGGDQYSGTFSLYQGYVEARLPESDRLALKGGRQEFNYGSAFVLGTDSFYNGLSFDAGRLRVKPLKTVTVDLLGGSYAAPFADGVKGNLLGAYVTYAPSEDNSIEAYVFRDTGSTERHAGEHLETWGLRSTSKLGLLTLEFEPIYQSGRVFNSTTGANEDISAYGGHIDLTAAVELGGHKNTIFLGYAVGSGNKDAANGLGSGKEFRNPNNDTSLMGDMGVVGDLSGINVADHHASGIQIFTLGWGIDFTDYLNFSATGRKFTAIAVEDGFSRRLGVETDFTLTWNINKDFSAIIGYDRFFTNKFFRDASGSDKDIDYGYAMLVFNFEKTKLKAHKM
ncbi:MAG: alginate export family protein [Desulfuromonadales bacterium]|nr:alginate export family protein [Desulfuromonadales bacterium]